MAKRRSGIGVWTCSPKVAINQDTSEFLNRNSDDFDWKYYSVRIVEEDGSLGCGYSCRSLSVAEKKFDEFAKKAQHIVLLDKSTRKILKEHKKGE